MDDFMAEFKVLVEKYELDFCPALSVTEQGIRPIIKVVDLKKKYEDPNAKN